MARRLSKLSDGRSFDDENPHNSLFFEDYLLNLSPTKRELFWSLYHAQLKAIRTFQEDRQHFHKEKPYYREDEPSSHSII